MALAGIPQWALARYYVYSGTIATTNEVDAVALNNQDNLGVFSGSASKTITAGPQTTGPVLIQVNGISFFAPFNVSCTLPNECWNSLNPVITPTPGLPPVTASIWQFA